jgi:hypothetical protein
MPKSPPLARSLTPRDHPPLVTLDEARRYMLALLPDMADRNAWQRAAALAIEALTAKLDLALFTTGQLDFK